MKLPNSDFVGFLLNATMLQAWIPGKALSYNFPGWSLSVEAFFYLLFPFLFNDFYKEIKLFKTAFWIILFFLLNQALFQVAYPSYAGGFEEIKHQFLYYFPLFHLNEFLVGNLAGLWFVKKMGYKTRPQGLPILLLCGLVAATLAWDMPLFLHNGLMALLFVPLILLICSDSGRLGAFMSHRAMVFLGEISFGIYILQVPVRNICYTLMDLIGFDDRTARFYFYLTALIITSAVCFIFIEKPLRRLLNGAGRSQR